MLIQRCRVYGKKIWHSSTKLKKKNNFVLSAHQVFSSSCSAIVVINVAAKNSDMCENTQNSMSVIKLSTTKRTLSVVQHALRRELSYFASFLSCNGLAVAYLIKRNCCWQIVAIFPARDVYRRSILSNSIIEYI